ncbi:hypothetical protein SCLCIDRAFT_1220572 [Scleroderma citrinum Foug A]|uniref:DUF6533 domain-containing protein n=1 Tax=Scleroderma citrinum Foug A TaxID=1036808 RepID=A0A0C3DIB0_9AGAM|nr:hypothetical protein SCLCIDRAFT_1220572 [Scleroderma citrinum Foug A]
MFSQLNIDETFNVIVFTVILHDYTLTIVREIELFWKRPKKSWAFALFVANRYITILSRVPFLLHSFWTPGTQFHSRCNFLRLFGQVEVFILQVVGSE